jgi:hypothetical protein
LKTYTIYHSFKELPKHWDSVVAHDVFLQSNYLKALEDKAPNNIQLYYIGVFVDQDLVGVAIIQRVQLYLEDIFRKTKVSCLKELIKSMLSKFLKGNILVVGNLTHTGQHGLFINEDKIKQRDCLDLVFQALEDLKKEIKAKQNKKIRAIMMKDYFLQNSIHNEQAFFETNNLYKVFVQPNMIMKIRPNWLTPKDYVFSLNKKYKRRYKTARTKLNAIKCLEMDSESIYNNSDKLYQLYLNVSNNAKFNTFILPQNHFYSLKLQLQDDFRVFGYYLNEELIGFYTLILNGKDLETYFLGYDVAHQYPNQLYLNMLYDMIEFAIENKFTAIVYARTAMEIKSSVGAKPETMVVYMKHTNSYINTLLKPIFNVMNPSQDWEERHPFRE